MQQKLESLQTEMGERRKLLLHGGKFGDPEEMWWKCSFEVESREWRVESKFFNLCVSAAQRENFRVFRVFRGQSLRAFEDGRLDDEVDEVTDTMSGFGRFLDNAFNFGSVGETEFSTRSEGEKFLG